MAYLTLKVSAEGYEYVERKGKDSVAFILTDGTKYGLTHEFKPPLQEWLITAFGGSIDRDTNLRDLVIAECLEETGYSVDGLEFMGKHFVSTQMNQYCYLFLVYVSVKKDVVRKTLDAIELKATTIWLDEMQILDIACWKAKLISYLHKQDWGVEY